MINAYDIAYGLGVGLSAPYWLIKPQARRKVFKAFRERMGKVPARDASRPAVMIHAVSLGEMNATRALVQALAAQRPELQFIVSTTTDTGYAAGQKAYGSNPDVLLIRYPLDFSPAVNSVLEAMRPSAVVLMELEVWPNFLRACGKRMIPVVLVNGRLTTGSFRNYRMGRAVVGRMFRSLARICVQDQTYAQRFIQLGARPETLQVTGTMKFDTAQVADRIAGDAELAAAVGLHPGQEPIWVCGSTGPGEEEIVLRAYRSLRIRHPRLRLVIVPRKPERFDEVAKLIQDSGFELVRRSRPEETAPTNGVPAVILGDTMGELRKFYSLADVIFVGRSLVDLGSRQHGSDMIEPAALAKPVVVGPFTANFAEVMNCFRAADAMVEITEAEELGLAIEQLLSTPPTALAMGRRAQQIVRQEQGATVRHAQVVLDQLNCK